LLKIQKSENVYSPLHFYARLLGLYSLDKQILLAFRPPANDYLSNLFEGRFRQLHMALTQEKMAEGLSNLDMEGGRQIPTFRE